ncbi:MAG: signal recognition particle receptor subunit alpha, partial [Clostridia bacterium]|nr:signal recognition particle receptor subunit alpha [Clostridia bacterium]
MGFFKKIIDGLRKTKQQIGFKLNELFKRGIFDEDFYEELEYILLASDVGEDTTVDIIAELRERMREDSISDSKQANEYLKAVLCDILGEETFEFNTPCVITVAGVNGVGKTTTIGKLANIFVKQGKSVVIAAADTFRAAASEQLEVWANRAKVRIIKHEEGSDPAA